jgi:hypothetical protein
MDDAQVRERIGTSYLDPVEIAELPGRVRPGFA